MNPTTIYVIWPGHTEADAINEVNQLGKFSYPRKKVKDHQYTTLHVFHKLAGWSIMEELIKRNRTDILEATKIVSSTGKTYTFEKFLNSLENVDIK